MGPSCLTVIIPICAGRTETLREILRTKIEPPGTSIGQPITGTKLMPFHLLGGLHFASIVILDGHGDGPDRLIFEATFDEHRDAFVANLVHAAPDGVHEIFSHCEGYPETGTTIPSALAKYLIGHDLGALLMYRGTPSRTVSQIRRETSLRTALQERAASAACLASGSGAGNPGSLGGLQALLQSSAVQCDPKVAWAEDRYGEPPEVRFGLWLMALRFLPVILALVALWMLAYAYILAPIADWLSGTTAFTHPFDAINDAYSYVKAACTPSKTGADGFCARAARLVGYPLLPFPPLAFLLICIALVIRWLQHNRNRVYLNPFEQTRANSLFANLLGAVRYAVAGLILLLFATAVLDVPDTASCSDADRSAAVRAFAWLLRPHSCHKDLSPSISCWAIVGTIVLVAAIFAVLLFMRTTIGIRSNFMTDIGAYDRAGKLKLDALRIGLLLSGGVLLVSIINIFSHLFTDNPFSMLPPGIALAGIALVALIFFSAVFWLLVWHGLLEYVEQRSPDAIYEAPDELIRLPSQNQSAYAREDTRNNRRQNHLVSRTHVKPGLWNYISLRATLYVIDVLGRYYFNKGTLGDIPTILSARWVLIENGKDRQLLFLDHYAGAWDSYLSEFVDMGAVKGVNAIWTNTFVKVRPDPIQPARSFEFPRTSHIFWKGAQNERPFKTYVRQSQIETLVWYSAYPDLDVVAINRATGHRLRLFSRNSMDQCDAILQDL